MMQEKAPRKLRKMLRENRSAASGSHGADSVRNLQALNFYSEKTEGNFDRSGKVSISYQVGVKNNACLRDHFVFGEYFYPTDAYVEMIYVAWRSVFKQAKISFKNVVISNPIVGSEGSLHTVSIVFTRHENGAIRFKVLSTETGTKENHHGSEKLNLRGEIVPCGELSQRVDNIADFSGNGPHKRGFQKEFNVADFYQPEARIRLGDFYKSLQKLYFYEDYALGEISVCHSDRGFLLNPSVMSAALGTAMSYAPHCLSRQHDIGEDCFLPYSIGAVNILAPLVDTEYTCIATVQACDSDWVDCAFQIVNKDGTVCVSFEELKLRRVKPQNVAFSAHVSAPVTHTQIAADNTVIEKTDRVTSDPVINNHKRDSQLTNSLAESTGHNSKTVPGSKAEQNSQAAQPSRGVAIVGMSCRYPGCNNAEEFWDVLVNGKDCITEVPAERWAEYADWYHPSADHEGTSHSKWGGYIDNHDSFDPMFFNISPSEAELMDPQQRVFMEECWKAIENAGYSPLALKNAACSVYAGCTTGDYSRVLETCELEGFAHAFAGTSSAILAARISYFLGLKGESVAVDTACSSSLTAIHLAAESIRKGDNQLAIAGGVNIFSTPIAHVLTSQVGMQSEDGRCHTFDRAANGTVFSEGCGVVILKDLEAAERDGDRILGVVKGSGVNQDGKTNGITAPSALSQTNLITDTYNKFNINPEDICYIEAHGTGTPLGDPIEVEGLTDAFKKFTAKKQYCAIGSVKSNMGHASYAAGVAGLIKLLLCLEHEQLVPSIHYNESNPHIDFNGSPFFVSLENTDLDGKPVAADKSFPVASASAATTACAPKMMAVSSFGFSGSNAHVVIEQYVKNDSNYRSPFDTFVIPLSAKTEESLAGMVSSLSLFLDNNNDQLDLPAIAYTLQTGRATFDCRVAFVARTLVELRSALREFMQGYYRDQVCFYREDTLSAKQPAQIDLNASMQKGLYADVARHWIETGKLNWATLYTDNNPGRARLPGYCFAVEHYWPQADTDKVEPSVSSHHPASADLSPVAGGEVKGAGHRGQIVATPAQTQARGASHETVSGKNVSDKNVSGNAVVNEKMTEALRNDLKGLINKLLKVPVNKIQDAAGFTDLGFDSINLAGFSRSISKQYSIELTPAVFFANNTIQLLADHLVESYGKSFSAFYSYLGGGEQAENPTVSVSRAADNPALSGEYSPEQPALSQTDEPIAIVGISGKFPMADDLTDYWNNLSQGKDCISEIPLDRWDWTEYYGDIDHDKNKTSVIWGGFIDGVREFDPQFFGLSPREAMLMDPQQRLLLLHTYAAMEDAGYDPVSFSGSNTGVFVGIGNDGYDSLIKQSGSSLDGEYATGTLPSIGPNRISYYFNLHGPSEPIETACASSLVAVHRAMNEIRSGTCDTAIAAGVNTIVTPHGHIAFSKSGLLSRDGRCKAFSDQADGFVRSEGVGVLLLKRLSVAEAAGDHIYAVLRSSAVNHGGRANFLTAPNPVAQASLLESAYKKSGVDPRTVTYIETHGTGTELGDAVEVEGLKTAFKKLYETPALLSDNVEFPEAIESHCGIGSVKSNIGHTELASGMASIVKVLFQMKNKTLAETIHCDEVNPYIQLEDSPFYIVREGREWQPLKDKSGQDIPLRAGISSFGLGGVNAHVVLEEYFSETPVAKGHDSETAAEKLGKLPQLFILSAKTQDQLKIKAQVMRDFLTEVPDISLADMAYTLQVGREAMDYRMAMIVSDKEETLQGLNNYLASFDTPTDASLFYVGDKHEDHSEIRDLLSGIAGKRFMEELVAQKDYDRLARLWTKGGDVDWLLMHKNGNNKRITLPAYPFSMQKIWVEGCEAGMEREIVSVPGSPEQKREQRENSRYAESHKLVSSSYLFNKWCN